MSMNFRAPPDLPKGEELALLLSPFGGVGGGKWRITESNRWPSRLKAEQSSTDLLNLLVENNGVEPLTSCVQGRRSSQLS